MRLSFKLGAFVAAAVLVTGTAYATPINEPPPVGAILDLNGTPVPHQYQNYTVNFTASLANSFISFSFREDPAFLELDDVTVMDITHPGPNLLLNGGFELGPVGANQPTDWTYLNIFGAIAAGTTEPTNPHSGSEEYFDGAVQAYDAITQLIPTTIGDQYQISFWLDDNGPLTTFSRLSTNGDITDTGGNGIDLLVYAGAEPTAGGTTPEPASLVLLGTGLAGLATRLRRRKSI